MANKLIYSSANPLQMFMPDLERDERYNTKDFTDFDFPETILPFEQLTQFCQPWQLNDTIQIQLQTNIGPVNFIIKDCKFNRVIDTIQFDQKQESENEPGLFIYECTVPLSNYEPGCYYVEFQFGGGVFTLRSGKLDFDELHEETVLMEAKHYEFREGIIYETGFFPSFRIPGFKKFDRNRFKNTTYEDQVLNDVALRNQKFRIWNLYTELIPDYFADMIAANLGCSDLRFDGKNYIFDKEFEFEPQGTEGVPMRAWSTPLRERYTRGGITYENDEPIDGELVVMVNVDSKGFGNSNSGSETIVTDVI